MKDKVLLFKSYKRKKVIVKEHGDFYYWTNKYGSFYRLKGSAMVCPVSLKSLRRFGCPT